MFLRWLMLKSVEPQDVQANDPTDVERFCSIAAWHYAMAVTNAD